MTRGAGPGIPSCVSATPSPDTHTQKAHAQWLHLDKTPAGQSSLRSPPWEGWEEEEEEGWGGVGGGQTGLNLLFYPDPWGSAGIYTPGPENGQDTHSSATPIVEGEGGVEGHA